MKTSAKKEFSDDIELIAELFYLENLGINYQY